MQKKIKEYLKKNSNIFHIILIIIGSIFIILPNLHTNFWFDESYSVALVNNSFIDIWNIGSNDVHPILYYMFLKVINIIFGQNILIYRLFSVFGIIILGLIGFTHIRKDYGKKEGMLFTFFSFFLPAILVYAGEIRMYTYTIVFVTLSMIYLLRYLRSSLKSDLIKFGLCSICSCYLHYYALIAMCFINLYLLIKTIKTKTNVSTFIKVATAQIILYLPWFLFFISQAMSVGGGFWISITYPDILFEILLFPFDVTNIFLIMIVPFYIYLGYLIYMNYRFETVCPLYVIAFVILMAMIASLISPILITRYLFTVLGLLIFTMSIYLAKANKYVLAIICSFILIISVLNNIENCKNNYDENSDNLSEFLKIMEEKECIIYSNDNINGLVFSLNNSLNQYFVNYENWGIKEAYMAYNIKVVDNIDDIELEDRFTLVLSSNEIPELLEIDGYKVENTHYFYTNYHEIYVVILDFKK